MFSLCAWHIIHRAFNRTRIWPVVEKLMRKRVAAKPPNILKIHIRQAVNLLWQIVGLILLCQCFIRRKVSQSNFYLLLPCLHRYIFKQYELSKQTECSSLDKQYSKPILLYLLWRHENEIANRLPHLFYDVWYQIESKVGDKWLKIQKLSIKTMTNLYQTDVRESPQEA